MTPKKRPDLDLERNIGEERAKFDGGSHPRTGPIVSKPRLRKCLNSPSVPAKCSAVLVYVGPHTLAMPERTLT